MSLLQESPLASSAVTKAVQELLSLQESDLAYDGWERPTRTLLECAAQASRLRASYTRMHRYLVVRRSWSIINLLSGSGIVL